MRRLSTLAGAAGFLLLLKVPAFAQSPVLTTSPPSSGNHDESQTLGDTAWWSQDDGSWGDDYEVYQLGWSPAGSCRSWSQPSWTGRIAPQWWSAGGTGVWFPGGSTFQYPFSSGWCRTNYGYANRRPYVLWMNRVLIPEKKHHLKRNNQSNNRSNAQTRATAENGHAESGHRELKADNWVPREGPDDDWTRVEDHLEDPRAPQRQYDQGIHALPRGQLSRHQALDRGHLAQQQRPKRVQAEKMRGLERPYIAQGRGLEHLHSAGGPATHMAARSGGRGHT
jgi:hypothetical protein